MGVLWFARLGAVPAGRQAFATAGSADKCAAALALVPAAATALALALAAATTGHAQETPSKATQATILEHIVTSKAVPPEGTRDARDSTRGFLATRADPVILNASGKPVWNLAAYDFVTGPAPDTVNPSLWRHMTHLKHHGLYQVTPNVWQVRGFDLSNMTIIRGQTGWIVIDPLTSVETAQAAMVLVNATLGQRPVSAVIYSHSHADHFGGVRGVIDAGEATAGRVAIIAPEGFMEEATSENVMAGGAMLRRAAYQFGTGLKPGPTGQMGSGIGMAVSGGTLSLVAPNDTVTRTGDPARIAEFARAEAMVAHYQENATADGLEGTPSFKINGTMHTNMSYDEMKAIIDAELAK